MAVPPVLGAAAPALMATPVGWVMAGAAILDLGFNLFGAFSGAKARKRAERRMRAAVREEQRIWDRDVGPVNKAFRQYLTGTEGAANAAAREAQVLGVAETALRVAAPAVAANTQAANLSLQSSFAGRGLGASGVAAQAATDLEAQRLATIGQMRGEGIQYGQEAWTQNMGNYLSLKGPRPTMSGVEQAIGTQYPVDQNVDIGGTVNALLSLAGPATTTNRAGTEGLRLKPGVGVPSASSFDRRYASMNQMQSMRLNPGLQWRYR
jgi:hypothetical protein